MHPEPQPLQTHPEPSLRSRTRNPDAWKKGWEQRLARGPLETGGPSSGQLWAAASGRGVLDQSGSVSGVQAQARKGLEIKGLGEDRLRNQGFGRGRSRSSASATDARRVLCSKRQSSRPF